MRRRPKRHPRDHRPHRLSWECLEDRWLLSGLGGLLPPVPTLVNIVSPSPTPVVVATSTATPGATDPAPPAPVLGLLSQTGLGGLLDTAMPPANPTSSGPPANPPPGGGALSLRKALTAVLGQVEQTATATLLNLVQVPSGGTSGSSGSGGLLGGGSLLGLSLSAGVGLGGGSGTAVQLGAQVDLLGTPLVKVSAGASLGQTTTGPGLGVSAGLNLGGSQLVSLGVTTDPPPGPSGGPGGGGGLTLAVGGLGIDVNLGGTGPVSSAVALGSETVVPGPTAGAGGSSPLDVNPGGETGNRPVVSVPPVVVEPPVVSVPPVVGPGPSRSEGSNPAPGNASAGGADVAPPLAEAPAVAAAVSAAQHEAGAAVPDRPAAPAVVPLAGGLFVNPDAGDPSRELPDEPAATASVRPAADRLAENLGADALFADPSLWGAGNADLWADDVIAELAAVTATPGRSDGAAAARAALLPGEALALPPSQEAGLLTACVPYDVQSLDLAFRRLMDQLRSLGWDFSGLLARLPGTPWVLMFAAMAVTCEACRRRLAKPRQRLAPAGGAGGTLTWFPSLSTHERGDEG